MLFYNTVEPSTRALLNELQSFPILDDFHLVGGTALSLKFGHRISVDLDLFSNSEFNSQEIIDYLSNHFRSDFLFESPKALHFGIFCFIRNVKVDFVRYPHALIHELEIIDGIKMYSDEDIAAMKVQAILGRGKKKDFWDMYELLQKYSMSEIMKWHKEKFPSQMLAISIPDALTYFTDADESEDPVSLKGQTWETVKLGIQKAVRDYLA